MAAGARQAWRRVFSFFRRGVLDRDLEEELASHVELAVEEHLRRGLSLPEARRRALIELGGVEAAKDRHRDARGLPWLDGILQDVRFAVRGFRRSPGFTFTAVATLAIGIGINAAVFTITKAALFAGFPHVVDNDRVVYLSTGRGCCLSYPDFEDWKAQAKSFTDMAVVHGTLRTLDDASGFPESDQTAEVSANTFTVVGVHPMLGRDLTPADAIPGAPPVVILSEGFWGRRFGHDPTVIGRTVQMNGTPTTIVGVMPTGFSFPQKLDFWVPLIPTPDVLRRENRGLWFAFGRLNDGATVESARAEMETIGRRLGAAYPLTNRGRNLLPHVQTFRDFFILPNEVAVYWAMWGAVALVLLIACANLANLLLARAVGRSREISVRVALGAGRWRIIRQLLIESAILSAVGSVLGWLLAEWGVRTYALADRGPGRASWRILDYSMDAHVLGYVIAISIGSAILFGMAPAVRLARATGPLLKETGRGTIGAGRSRHVSALLVTGEMALAVVLLTGAGVMIRSFLNIYTANLGVESADILTMSMTLPDTRYRSAEQQVSFFDQLKRRLESVPGVESAAFASALPGSRAGRLPFELAGFPPLREEQRPTAAILTVGPDYFRTLGVRLLLGRTFTDFDDDPGASVAIVNERFAARYWPGEDPSGKRLRLFEGRTPGPWLTVVGVTSDVPQNGSSRQDVDPVAYLPYRQRPAAEMDVLARTRVPPGSLAIAFRRQVQALDAALPIVGPQTLDEGREAAYWSNGLYGALFALFAAIALLLAAVGLYAVVAHAVGRRTQEIGVRMAMGATSHDVLALVLRQGLAPVGIGLMIGLLGALGVTPVLRSFLVQVSPADPLTFIGASIALVAAGVLGCLIPARRAMRVEPAVALRHE